MGLEESRRDNDLRWQTHLTARIDAKGVFGAVANPSTRSVQSSFSAMSAW